MKNEIGALILRVVLGLIFTVNGLVKFQGGIKNTAGWFESINLPGFLAYGVAGLELVGGILLIIGFATRILSALFVILMAGAIVTAKLGAGFIGGYEFDMALMAMAIFLTISNSRLYAVDRLIINRN